MLHRTVSRKETVVLKDMDDTIKGQVQEKSLITDIYFYKHIFKKTEKIVSAVFFIISKRQTIPRDNVVRADLERRAKDTHSVALSLLSLEPASAEYGMQTLLHGLIALDSILRVYAAMGGISEGNREAIAVEIEGVQRSMRRYLGEDTFDLEAATESTPRTTPARTPALTPSKTTGTPTTTTSASSSRKERIMDIVRDSDGVGIKDISLVITDCSEKTIQRELMSLIEEGLVRKEGERRWSRYFVA